MFLFIFFFLPKVPEFAVAATSKADCTDSIFSHDDGINSPLLVARVPERHFLTHLLQAFNFL